MWCPLSKNPYQAMEVLVQVSLRPGRSPVCWGGEGKTAADFWGRQVVQSQIQQKHYRETTGDQEADKKF